MSSPSVFHPAILTGNEVGLAADALVHTPVLFRLSNEDDQLSLHTLLQQKPYIRRFDTIFSQLKELLKSRQPGVRPDTATLEQQVEEYVKKHAASPEAYGVWVYYPWSERLVHILDEAEFAELRTDRNRNKITLAERAILSTKKIGVIGLSVGQSVSLTMAMERGFGELRIADFDELELTNLNRLRSGVHNMGIRKTVLVAREIAEIDPYLKVTCFHEGITDDNLEDFLLKNGQLDLLIDECDSLDIKVICRQKAKAAHIPVVMEASDRGTIDVERFDLEPDRPVLHGFVEHLDLSKIRDLKTNEEKVPYLLAIAGAATISTRAKASMLEIGQTISTWPQLASAVALGGGLTADVVRRILLDQFHESGRYFIDVEELMCDKVQPVQQPAEQHPSLTEAEMVALINQLPAAAPGTIPAKELISTLVAAAIQAPTNGNAQPWRWKYYNGRLYLFADNVYSGQLADFQQAGSLVGLGAATENLLLKAASMGYAVETGTMPLGEQSRLVAVFSFSKQEAHPAVTEVTRLAAMIEKRQTNRTIQPSAAIAFDQLQQLQDAAHTIAGAGLHLLTDASLLQKAANLIGKTERMRILHPQGHTDFVKEIAWTAEDAETTRRGIDLEAFHLPPSGQTAFRLMKEWPVVDYLNQWQGGAGLERLSRTWAGTAAALGLLTMPSFSKKNNYLGGRALERVWLTATALDIAFQPFNTVTSLFNRLDHEGEQAFPPQMREELKQLREEFAQIFGVGKDAGAVLVFRLFLTENTAKKSLRIPAAQVLSFD